MTSLLLAGWLIGIGVAAPIGPVSIAVIRAVLDRGFRAGMAVALGAATADSIYLTVILFGIGALFNGNALATTLMGFLGGAVLLGMAIRGIRSTLDPVYTVRDKVISGYLGGFIITLLSPFTFVSWLSIASATGGLRGDLNAPYALSALVGVLTWFVFLCAVLTVTRRLLPPRVMVWINLSANVALAVLAVLLIIHTAGST